MSVEWGWVHRGVCVIIEALECQIFEIKGEKHMHNGACNGCMLNNPSFHLDRIIQDIVSINLPLPKPPLPLGGRITIYMC